MTAGPSSRRRFLRRMVAGGAMLALGRVSAAGSDRDAVERIVDRLEVMVGEDIGGRRGIGPLVDYSAQRHGLLGAARSIAETEKPRVGILTGFYTPHAKPPSCETDGPPGAAHIARAFHAAGWDCRVATDRPNERVVVESLAGAGLPKDFLRANVDVVSVDGNGVDGGRPIYDVVEDWRRRDLSHVVSVERAGPGRDGRPHNFQGFDISRWTAPMDRLFEAGDWTTIGIGDGGNEIGMGNLPRDLVAKNVPKGALVGCVTRCDHLLVCGVSNWGGWALSAAVALLRPELKAQLVGGSTARPTWRSSARPCGGATPPRASHSPRALPGNRLSTSTGWSGVCTPRSSTL